MQKAIEPTEKQIGYFHEFKNNLLNGIEYYRGLIPKMIEESQECRDRMFLELMTFKKNLEELFEEHKAIFAGHLVPVTA